MNVIYKQSFVRNYKKRFRSNSAIESRLVERVEMFKQNPSNPFLHDHPLKGEKQGVRAFSITGDIRVMYIVKDGIAYFLYPSQSELFRV